MKSSVCLVALSIAAVAPGASAGAQRVAALYRPRAVERAFQNGTRSPSGRPGATYWQNRARYVINVTASPPDRTIRGSEHIVYVNDSPDTLSRVVIELFLNIHRAGVVREAPAGPDYFTEGARIDSFTVNGQSTPWHDPGPATWAAPAIRVAPHDSVRLAFAWHYEISREANREGMLDSTTYYLAYFYPRVAVYDDYNGWDTMNFTDLQEFYSDFNDYDVTVRVPANFIVWGTGTLQNAAETLQPEFARRLQASFTSDSVVHVATHAELLARTVTRPTTNVWHFTAIGVPDMTFALSDHYDWDAASVVVDDATHRRASVQSAYNDTAADFHHMVHFGQHALDWLSHHWPGVPYPYEKSTIVQGGADMEYPMMVNDGSNADTTFSRFVAEHEIAHTYFPFYTGINETRYGFMDEGWATTFEYLVGLADVGKTREGTFFNQFRVNEWARDPSPLEDLPIITPEDVLTGVAYGNNAYGKPALGYLAMKDLLGDDLFKRCLQAFIDRWHGKHPIPWDLFDTFDDVSGRDLTWFWRAWFFEPSYIDLGVAGVTHTAGSAYTVAIDNTGGMPAPVDVVLTYTDGSTETIHETPAIWQRNGRRASVRVNAKKPLRSVQLAGGIWMDANPSNNTWRLR